MTLPAVRRPPPRPVLTREIDDREQLIPVGLGRALCHGGLDEFVREVDGLVGGPVTLLDRTDEVLATSRPGSGREPARVRQLVLQDAGEVVGVLELPPTAPWSAALDRTLRDVGAALLRQHRHRDEVRQLRHRVSLLSWLSARPELAPAASAGPEPACCRPVVAVAARHGGYPGIARRLAGACAAERLLAGLSLVPADDALVGLYESDPDGPPQQHARAWSRALRAARVDGLTLAVGRPTGPGAALQESYLQARRLAILQRDRSGYLELPVVAVTDELGPMADVLASVSAGQVTPFVERVLGDLVTDGRFGGQLVETLYAYLTTGGSPQEAGRLLHLHPSSVKYRMRVIRELLGARLEDPAQRFDLELAVRLHLAARELRERCAGPPEPAVSRRRTG
ncbi:PucR family transcriptional regulator [Pseudonocardia sp.]|uniref:PucR family transcriptional regulator n=1 Tax=Pseudonocardia sp. TaxID=60912 RepID=UPI003D105524